MFILLEYKCNMLQLVLGICSIEVSEQNCIPMAIAVCLQENLQLGNPSWSDSFLTKEEIHRDSW